MRSKSIVLLALALGCGLVASIGISQVMEKRGDSATPGETATIIVALTDINTNDALTPQNIKLEEWPKDKVPPNAVTKIEEIDGKRSKGKIYAGEPILAGKIMAAGESNSAEGLIPKGFRVVAVRVDQVSASGNLLLPGSRVDVLVYIAKNPGIGVNETTTKTLLRDIKIFAVDTTTTRDNEKNEVSIAAKTVSLLVTPQQAERVTLATEMGTIRLVLRSPDEDSSADSASEGTTTSDIFSGSGESSDRNKETGNTPPSPSPAATISAGKSFLDLLKEMKRSQGPAAVGAAPPQAGPFKMLLLKGTEKVEYECTDTDGIPTAAPIAPSTKEPESTLSVQEEQPVAAPPGDPDHDPFAEKPEETPSTD